MNTNISIEQSSPYDLQAIQHLLASASLPWQDIQHHFEYFMVARSPLGIAGCAGLERAGNSGLLRSLAVAAPHQKAGLGTALCTAILDRARHLGFDSVYLLTTTAEKFFARFGFERISRERAPREISNTAEFRTLCPSTAALMVLHFRELRST
ncbi:MAG TPA: arsenic resistance N-acetyltransferase ArsN2 [Acidobacteriota bacterium]|nr:arsenic resistance N-acetyltransferase ArsN2 [Acidobacteriota bacterium]